MAQRARGAFQWDTPLCARRDIMSRRINAKQYLIRIGNARERLIRRKIICFTRGTYTRISFVRAHMKEKSIKFKQTLMNVLNLFKPQLLFNNSQALSDTSRTFFVYK